MALKTVNPDDVKFAIEALNRVEYWGERMRRASRWTRWYYHLRARLAYPF